MLALSVYPPGVEPRAPERFGFISIEQALAVAQHFVQQGACVDVYEYAFGHKPTLVKHLEPESVAAVEGER